MTQKVTFPAIPDIPTEGMSDRQYAIFMAMKESIEILAGARTQGIRAITSNISTAPRTMVTQERITAAGTGYQANSAGALTANARVANVDDYVKLCQDVQNIMSDMVTMQQTINALLTELRS